ncbi:hypothetical protein Tco_0301840, partial [Tanacetum coccineum]
SCPQLDHEDLEQLDEYDLEEMDLKWQLVLIKPKSNAIIATRHAILLESVEPREIKIVGGEMLGTLAIRMEEDLAQTQSDASIEIKAYTQGLKKVEA